jgi:hypothetical protein
VDEVKIRVEEGIPNMRNLLNEKAPLAKAELHQYLDEIRMSPASDGKDWYYVAEGEWDLLGVDSGLASGRPFFDWRLEMVAGACNALKALVLPFRYKVPVSRHRRFRCLA